FRRLYAGSISFRRNGWSTGRSIDCPPRVSVARRESLVTSPKLTSREEGAIESECRIALVGFGTVGRSVARILTSRANSSLKLTHVFNRNVDRKRVEWVPSEVRWTQDFDDVLKSDADVLLELVGGLEPAEQWVRRALESGKSVVTANK